MPRPGKVSYKDHIEALHLVDVVPENSLGEAAPSQAVVYLWSMRDNVWTLGGEVAAGRAR